MKRSAVYIVGYVAIIILLFRFVNTSFNIRACEPPLSTCCAVPTTINSSGTGCNYTKVCSYPSACSGRVRVCGQRYVPGIGFIPWCVFCSRYPTGGCAGGGGGGGGGNNPPSCSINLSSPITYDAKEFLADRNTALRYTQQNSGGSNNTNNNTSGQVVRSGPLSCRFTPPYWNCGGYLYRKACDITVSQITATSAKITWKPASPAWPETDVYLKVCRGIVYYAGPSQCAAYNVKVSRTNSYTVTNLLPNTRYTVLLTTYRHADYCQGIGFHSSVSFTTPNVTPTPTPTPTPISNVPPDSNNGWVKVTLPPTTIEGTINTSDPDGDSVRITRMTVSKPSCLKVTRDGRRIYATPQGKVTGKTPSLNGPSYCNVTIRVQVSDGKGGTNNCSKTVRVNYPKPRIWSIWLYDHNDVSVERQPANTLRDNQFYFVGSYNFTEPFRTNGAKLIRSYWRKQHTCGEPFWDAWLSLSSNRAQDHKRGKKFKGGAAWPPLP